MFLLFKSLVTILHCIDIYNDDFSIIIILNKTIYCLNENLISEGFLRSSQNLGVRFIKHFTILLSKKIGLFQNLLLIQSSQEEPDLWSRMKKKHNKLKMNIRP